MGRSGRWTACRYAMIAALIAPLSAQAQSLDAARAFTLKLYGAYRSGDADPLGKNAPTTFAPGLLGLIQRDRATTPPGDVGILDGDPICDCQDSGGIRLTRLSIKGAGSRRAHADVTLRFPSETRSVKLDLVAWRGTWRVADVHTRDTPSLVRLLEDGLRGSAGVR